MISLVSRVKGLKYEGTSVCIYFRFQHSTESAVGIRFCCIVKITHRKSTPNPISMFCFSPKSSALLQTTLNSAFYVLPFVFCKQLSCAT